MRLRSADKLTRRPHQSQNAFQLKYYARGVGNVRIGWRGDDSNREEMELVDVVELDPEALAQVRVQALELEKRAYIYGRTSPAEQNRAPALVHPKVESTNNNVIWQTSLLKKN